MIKTRGRKKAAFVIASVILSLTGAYAAAIQAPLFYQARLYFQIAAPSASQKPDLRTEKKLLLSDSLLSQVLKDANLLPVEAAAKFRSFDLGPDLKTKPENIVDIHILQPFKDRLDIADYPRNSVMGISYRDFDANQARRVVETLFEKYSDWRQAEKAPGFSQKKIDADKNLTEKRETFLQSQKAFLDYVEANGDGKGKADSRLMAKKTELDATIASLKLRYGPKHPVLVEALHRQEILNRDIAKRTGGADQARLTQLRAKMETDFKNLDIAIRESVILEQQNKSSLSAIEILPLGDVEVRIAPRYIYLKTFMGGIAGLILSLLYLILRSLWYQSVETGKQLGVFGYPVLSRINGLLKDEDGELPLPAGATADAIKTLRQELKLRSWTSPVKLITVTSTFADEGRSELVAGLGRLSARNREKVLILDADLRTPTLQQKMPLKSVRNLVDYLSGQARLEDIIVRGDPSGAHLIYGTAIPNTSLDLLSSDKMKTLLLSLREAYDLVLVQAPVSPRGPDARVLGALSDQTLYAVRIEKTPLKDLKQGIAPFQESGIKSVSFILTDK